MCSTPGARLPQMPGMGGKHLGACDILPRLGLNSPRTTLTSILERSRVPSRFQTFRTARNRNPHPKNQPQGSGRKSQFPAQWHRMCHPPSHLRPRNPQQSDGRHELPHRPPLLRRRGLDRTDPASECHFAAPASQRRDSRERGGDSEVFGEDWCSFSKDLRFCAGRAAWEFGWGGVYVAGEDGGTVV